MDKPKKLLDNPLLGSLVMPIAVILVASIIIFGGSKLLFTERSHKDLVYEMKSKTFGNRWVAAFELSKLISSSSIPQKDIPQLVDDLASIYRVSQDPRTRDFLIVAFGALKSPQSLPILSYSLQKETNPNILFHTIVALGNMPEGVEFDWDVLISYLDQSDNGLKHAAILALANHHVEASYPKIETLLSNEDRGIRFAAATALISSKNQKVIPVLKEILSLNQNDKFKPQELTGLKLNVLNELEKSKWADVKNLVFKMMQDEENIQLKARAEEVYKDLNN
ncbi:MAG: hypothetical protein DRQ88_03060 [Epsilonproteobacteria bacterium]|nr:MAG: hypothetical protein DRQ89_02015 [Campylobacterota bacterium]RLA67452.1 MAG: hypothetical protein DRQ88_03060 [Campylobacterota bacterium]